MEEHAGPKLNYAFTAFTGGNGVNGGAGEKLIGRSITRESRRPNGKKRNLAQTLRGAEIYKFVRRRILFVR